MNARIEWIDEPLQVLGRADPSVRAFGHLGVVSDECRANPRFQDCLARGGTEEECALQECATGERIPIEEIEEEDRQDYPWMKEAPLTCDLQVRINRTLEDEGYHKIEEDCVLGPRTCGAARALLFEYEPLTCREWEDPVPKTEPPPDPPPPPTCAADEKFNPATGQCEKISCPDGQVFDPDKGECVRPPSPTTAKAKKKSSWGLFILGAAALAGIYYGVA